MENDKTQKKTHQKENGCENVESTDKEEKKDGQGCNPQADGEDFQLRLHDFPKHHTGSAGHDHEASEIRSFFLAQQVSKRGDSQGGHVRQDPSVQHRKVGLQWIPGQMGGHQHPDVCGQAFDEDRIQPSSRRVYHAKHGRFLRRGTIHQSARDNRRPETQSPLQDRAIVVSRSHDEVRQGDRQPIRERQGRDHGSSANTGGIRRNPKIDVRDDRRASAGDPSPERIQEKHGAGREHRLAVGSHLCNAIPVKPSLFLSAYTRKQCHSHVFFCCNGIGGKNKKTSEN